MATLIAWYVNGECRGRCDAKCYTAREPECTCICGGLNHGAGFATARENTQERSQEWVDGLREELGPEISGALGVQAVLGPEAQPDLFSSLLEVDHG